MATKCRYCGLESKEPEFYHRNFCDTCVPDKEIGFPYVRETVSLHTMKNVSKTRLAELDKRTMLPDAVKDHDYVVGRKDRGKITDQSVDLRP